MAGRIGVVVVMAARSPSRAPGSSVRPYCTATRGVPRRPATLARVPRLVLGPMLRYVDEQVATVWVQTDAACDVEIGGTTERTWCVDGLHFALVAVGRGSRGPDAPYEGRPGGGVVWPQPGGDLPPSTIGFLDAGRRLQLVFGSCRITRRHEEPWTLRSSEHPDGQGVDALRAYAARLAAAGGG